MKLKELKTPIGYLTLIATRQGLRAIQFGSCEEKQCDTDKSDTVVILEHLETAASQLREYFCGDRRNFDLTLDPAPKSNWTHTVIASLCTVCYGQITTYGELAKRVSGGNSGSAARAIGSVMRSNTLPLIWPCHRVVGSDGSLTGYSGGLDSKRWLLELERAHA